MVGDNNLILRPKLEQKNAIPVMKEICCTYFNDSIPKQMDKTHTHATIEATIKVKNKSIWIGIMGNR